MTSRIALVRRRHTRKARLARSRLTARKKGVVHANALKRRSRVQRGWPRWLAAAPLYIEAQVEPGKLANTRSCPSLGVGDA